MGEAAGELFVAGEGELFVAGEGELFVAGEGELFVAGEGGGEVAGGEGGPFVAAGGEDVAEAVGTGAGGAVASNAARVAASMRTPLWRAGPGLASGRRASMSARRAVERASVPPPMFLLRTLVALALAAPPGAAPVLAPRDYGGPDQPAAAATTPDSGAPADPTSPSSPSSPDFPAQDTAPLVPQPNAATPTADPPATAPQPTAPRVEGPVDEPEPDELPYDPLVDSPEAIRARQWVRSGIVFMALGGMLSIGAIAMSQAKVNDPETGAMPCNNRGDPAGNGCTLGGRQRATAALAVPGGLLLAGGIAMLVVGKSQQKRLAADLHADRRGFRIGLTLRF